MEDELVEDVVDEEDVHVHDEREDCEVDDDHDLPDEQILLEQEEDEAEVARSVLVVSCLVILAET